MNVCGIIIAKENSNRFTGKNNYVYIDKPLFAHSLSLLLGCNYIDDVYVATDSQKIKNYCRTLVGMPSVIDRGINIIADEQPYFDVLKFAYQSINKRYDIIVTVLANSIDHTEKPITEGILKMFTCPDVYEIRSFDEFGNQSGILMFREKIITDTYNISNHMASVRSDGREIHYRSELV